MSRWADLFARLLTAAKQGSELPVRPKEVDVALEQDYDLEAYRKAGGGVAPPDAPRIEGDGI